MNRAQRRKAEAMAKKQSVVMGNNGSYWAEEGLKAAQSGQWPLAIHCFRKAVQISPNEAAHWNNLSAAYCREGNYQAAQESAEEAIAINPSYLEAVFNYATALKMSGDIAGAMSAYRALLAQRPHDLDAMINLAGCYMQSNDPDCAEQLYAQALIQAPADPLLLANMAALLYQAGKVEEALPYLERAVPFANYGVHYNFGLCCFHLGRLGEAKEHLQKAVAINPLSPDALSSLSAVLLLLGENEEALQAACRAIELAPQNIAMLNNYAAALDANGREGEALDISRDVLHRAPGEPGALVNLAILLRRQHRWEEVISYLNLAIEAEPDNASPHFYLCGTYFLLNDLPKAWHEFRWRWQKKGERPRSRFSCPRWEGEDLKGKSLLLWGEQGIGDEIMFSSMIAELKEKGARLSIECEERLVPLFCRSFPYATIRPHPMDDQGPALDRTYYQEYDYEAAFGDLGEYLRNDSASFLKTPYLRADDAMVSSFRHRYELLAAGKKIIGISWRSGNRMSGRRRSAPLELWQKLFSTPNNFYVSLQYGDVSDAANHPIHIDETVDPKRDMDLFAAQVAAMDLIISIDNTTVHMAGALGKPVWNMLSYYADVRWGLTGNSTPWYPSMRLFRQPRNEAWSEIFAQAAEELMLLAEN